MKKDNIEKIMKLTSGQEGILYQCLSDNGRQKYVVQRLYKVNTKIDIEQCQSVLDKLSKQYSALRTVVLYEGVDQQVKIVLKTLENNVDIKNVDTFSEVERVAETEYERPFDFQNNSSIRFCIIRQDNSDYLCLTSHHLLIDGQSFDNIVSSFEHIYTTGQQDLKTSPSFEKEYFKVLQQKEGNCFDYWKRKGEGFQTEFELIDIFSEKNIDRHWLSEKLFLSIKEVDNLSNISKMWNITTNSILEYIWAIVQAKTTLSNTVHFARAVSGRECDISSMEYEVGNFVNTIPAIVAINMNESVKDSLISYNSMSFDDIEHQFCSFSDIMKSIQIASFSSIVVNNNYSVHEKSHSFLDKIYEKEENEFPIHFIIDVDKGELSITINYDSGSYSDSFIQHLLMLYKDTLNILCSKNDNIKNEDLFFSRLNNIIPSDICTKSPVEQFMQSVNKHPNKEAIVDGNRTVSYLQVFESAKKISSFLQGKYGNDLRNQVVVLKLDKSIELIMAMYGCWMSGAAYFILDSKVPIEREKSICKDSQPFAKFTRTDIMSILSNEDYGLSDEFEVIKNDKDDVACFIYTSGSTGIPKGVKVSFNNLGNFITLNNIDTIIRKDDIYDKYMLSISSTSFDVFQTEVHVPLNNSGTIVIANEINILNSLEKVTIIQITPTKFQYIFDTEEKRTALQQVELIILCGEKLPSSLIQDIRKYTKATITNGYGPTECTIFSTFKRIGYEDELPDSKIMSVGHPYSNYQVSVERTDKVCLDGVIGEVVIYGPGVTLGYQNLKSDAYLKSKNGYRSGDLGFLMSNGELKIVDRIDNQVKLNGYRIELEEIEYQMRQMPDVDFATVTLDKIDGYDYLSAYYVSDVEIDIAEFKRRLKYELMPYMVPNQYIKIDYIPTNLNGKIDKSKLPKLKFTENYDLNDELETVCQIAREILSIDKLNYSDNLLEKGLTSLLSIRLIARINKVFGTSSTISDIFYNPTVFQFYTVIKQHKSVSKKGIKEPIGSNEFSQMTEVQKRIYINQQKNKDISYNIPYLCKLKEELSLSEISNAIDEISNRYKMLKMNLVFNDNGFERIPREKHNNKVYEVNEHLIASIHDLIKPFDISSGESFRVFLISTDSDSQKILFDFHHAFFDGISVVNFFKEFSILLEDIKYFETNEQEKDNLLPATKKDYEIVDRRYWEEKVSSITPNDISNDFIISKSEKTNGNTISITIPDVLWQKILNYSILSQSTPNIILMSVYAVLLQKYSNNSAISFSFPISGREYEDDQQKIDVFVKTLFISLTIDESTSFGDVVTLVKQNFYEAISHSTFVPSHEIDFVFAHQPNNVSLQFLNETIDIQPIHNKTSKFKLSMLFSEFNDNNRAISIEYDINLYEKVTIEYMLKHFVSLVNNSLEDTEEMVGLLSVLDDDELDILKNTFNSPISKIEKNESVLKNIYNLAISNPSKTALYFNNGEMSYKELINKVIISGECLKSQYEIERLDKVGIYLDRTPELIITMLAIMYVGACYVPLSKEYPNERLSFIEEDSDFSMVIVDRNEEKCLFSSEAVTIKEISIENSNFVYNPDDFKNTPAYIIYTSGTTGKPKGVEVTKANLANFCQDNMITDRTKHLCDYVLFVNDYVFDITVQEIYLPLANGIPVIISDDSRETPSLDNYQNVGLFLTPSRLKLIPMNVFEKVSLIMMGGESFDVPLYQEIYQKNNKIVFIQGYGPTEATVGSAYYELTEKTRLDKRIPIGKPIKNYGIKIVNSNFVEVGIDMIGEIVIYGQGIAKGYLNRKNSTDQVFIEDQGVRYYRTGDLGRWRLDGNIEFFGRKDQQVKINGYRIELSEIEQVLVSNTVIRQAKVLVDRESSSTLAAYLISDEKIDLSDIMKKLKKELPKYMIPRKYAQIDEFPIKETGKLDVDKLPMPIAVTNSEKIILPVTIKEKKLVEIISNLMELDVKDISMTSNIFDLGAQSVLILSLIREIERVFQKQILISQVFKNPTINEILYLLLDDATISFSKMQHEELQHAPMTDAQMRMYYLNESIGGTVYNVPFLYSIATKIDTNLIFSVFTEIVDNHVEYHTAFIMDEEGYRQDVAMDYDIDFKDLGEVISELSDVVNELTQPFDLKKGNLIRLRVFSRKGKQFIFLDSHHIVSDEQSIKILLDEFVNKLAGSAKSYISELTYLDYSNFVSQVDLTLHEDFWKKEIVNLNGNVALPKDFFGDNTNFYGNEFVVEVEKTKIKQLNSNALTASSYFQSVFSMLMYMQQMQEKVTIGVPVSGRNIPNSDKIIGLFVNTIPVNFDFSNVDIKFDDFLLRSSEHFLQCLDHQIYPFNKIVDLTDNLVNSSINPLFNVFYSYHAKEDNLTRLSANGLELNAIELLNPYSKFDLSLTVHEEINKYSFQFEFKQSMFRLETIEHIAEQFIQLIEVLQENNQCSISYITQLALQGKRAEAFGEPVDLVQKKNVVQLLEDHVKLNPEKIAIIDNERKLTFSELYRYASVGAHILRTKYDVCYQDRVAFIINRSTESVVLAYATLLAGASYAPLSKDYPINKLNTMIDNLDPKVVISDLEVNKSVPRESIINEIRQIATQNLLVKKNSRQLIDSDIAYIIHTSGSTGIPKAVPNSHFAVKNLLVNLSKVMNSDESILHKTPLSFGVSMTELFGSLIHGCPLVILEESKEKSADLIVRKIIEHNVKYVNFVASFLPTFCKDFYDYLEIKGIHHEIVIMCAGEPLSRNALEYFNNTISKKGSKLINLYGSSETAVYFTFKDVTNKTSTKIGKPFTNTNVLIVDEENNMVPLNTLGRILVSGDSIFSGYLNNPNPNKSKFIEVNNKVYFDMGDLGKIDHSNELVFYGRADNQVQLLGVRIELEEIEMAAKSIPFIENAVAFTIGEDDNRRINIIIKTKKESLDKKALDKYFLNLLPQYMLPATYYSIDEIPNLPSGKIDRRGIINADIIEIVNRTSNLRNETKTEKEIISIISHLLSMSAENITFEDSFFRLGGNSILLLRLLNQIERKFAVKLSILNIFERSTIREIAEDINEYSVSNIKRSKLEHAEAKSRYLMSDIQKRMFISQKLKNDSAYNVTMGLRISGRLNVEKLILALNSVIKKHSILRTALQYIEGEYWQIILPSKDIDVVVDNKSYLKRKVQPTSIIHNFIRPFNLEIGETIRAGVYKIEENQWLFILDLHHVVTDDLSNRLILHEISYMYNYEQKAISEDIYQYVDFSEERNFEEVDVFWKNYLFQIDLDNIDNSQNSISLDTKVKRIRADFGKTRSLSRKMAANNVSSFSYFASCYAFCLRQIQKETQVIFGMPLDQRNSMELDKSLGMYSDSIPFVVNVENSVTFDELLKNVSNIAKSLIGKSSKGVFEHLTNKFQSNNKGLAHLYSNFFVFNDSVQEEDFYLSGISNIETITFENNHGKFDMTFIINDEGDYFSIEVEYDENIHKKSYVEALLNLFLSIVGEGIENSGLLSSFESSNEYKLQAQMKYVHNGLILENPYSSIVDRINEICRKFPNNIAMRHNSEEITYGELDKITSRAASYLIKEYRVNGQNVAINIKRSIPQILAIISTLKAGAAYVPVSEEYPYDRVRQVLEGLNPCVLLTDNPLIFKDTMQDLVSTFEEISNPEYVDNQGLEPQLRMENSSLAYIMFTSGTTGKPKGVQVSHGNLLNLNLYFEHELKVNSADTVLQYANIGFDGSVWEIFMAILNGATLQLIDKDDRLVPEIMDRVIKNNSVTIAAIPSHVVNDYDLSPLRLIINGGTMINYDFLKRYVGKKRIINSYGPTECTVAATHYEVQLDDRDKNIPIGKPNPNINIHLFDNGKICDVGEVGEVGEICIGGLSTSQGYLQNEVLNKSVFVTDESSKVEFYKTGDLGSWDRYGNLIFHGRKDDQIKINGYRIELDEIRSHLLSHQEIEDVVVVYDKIKFNRIFAFVKGDIESVNALRKRVMEKLPEYMVPSKIFVIKDIPLTSNGKPDKEKLLSQMQGMLIDSLDSSHHNMNYHKNGCYSIIKESLGFSPDINKSYAENGGDSLVAMKIISSLKRNNFVGSIRDLLKMNTLKEFIMACSKATDSSEKQLNSAYTTCGTPIMRDFKHRNLPNASHFSQMVLVAVDKNSSAILIKAIEEIISKHDALRISVSQNDSFRVNDSSYSKYSFVEYAIENDLCQDDVTKISIETSNRINLHENNLVSISFIKTKTTNYALLCIHHLLVDVVSWSIILEDLDQYLKSQTVSTNSVQLGKVIDEINNIKSSDDISIDLNYWSEIVSNKGLSQHDVLEFATSVAETQRVLNLSSNELSTLKKRKYTIEETLIASAIRSYTSVFNKEKIQVMLENHGRHYSYENEGFVDSVGWFTSEYPLNFHAKEDLTEQLHHVTNIIEGVPNKGITYNLLKQKLSYIASPDITINYLGDGGQNNSWQVLHKTNFDLGPMIAPENYEKAMFMLLVETDKRGMIANLIFDSSVYCQRVVDEFFDLIEKEIKSNL